MTFSVIIPTLGRPAVLRETMRSIAKCVRPPLEIVVVDGDPGRSSAAVVGEFAGRPVDVSYVCSPPGLTRQRNEGIVKARGDVIVFFDDDVIVNADVFTVLDETFSDPTIVGATGRILEPRSGRIVGKHSRIRNLMPGGGREGTFTRYGYPRRIVDVGVERDVELMHGSFMSARANVVRDVGFDETLPGYGVAEDEDFAIRLSRRGRIRYVPSAVVQHLKIGHGTRDARSFGRQLVVNRAYLFRKNFRTTAIARAQFWLLIALLAIHRAINREWQELRGLSEGAKQVWKGVQEVPATASKPGPLRVLFVSSHSRRGGSERYLENVASRLGDGWVARVVCLEEGPLTERLRGAGIPVTVLPTSGSVRSITISAYKLRSIVTASRAEVVHANGIKAACVAALGLAGRTVPIVWFKHDFTFDGALARIIAVRCRKIVSVSNAVASTFGPKKAKVRVIHTGVEMNTLDRTTARASLLEIMDVSRDSAILGLVGRIHPVKGHSTLLEIAPHLTDRVPNLQIAFFGAGDPSYPSLEENLKERARRTGIGDRVHWLGYREDLNSLLGGLDAVVFPSGEHRRGPGREGFPLAALESMAAGTPVIGFDSGGFPEAVGDCGLVVAYGDYEGLVESIARVLQDGEVSQRLSDCGRRRVEARFAVPNMLDEVRSVYAEAAA